MQGSYNEMDMIRALYKHDTNKEVRIMRQLEMSRGLPKMCHKSSGRRPSPWAYGEKKYIWVEKGSLDHKRAIRGELVLARGWSTKHFRYALAPLC